MLAGTPTTLVDALSTLALLGDRAGFRAAVEALNRTLSFDRDVTVSVFETNIRLLGGLLSAHLLASDPRLGLGCEGASAEASAAAGGPAEEAAAKVTEATAAVHGGMAPLRRDAGDAAGAWRTLGGALCARGCGACGKRNATQDGEGLSGGGSSGGVGMRPPRRSPRRRFASLDPALFTASISVRARRGLRASCTRRWYHGELLELARSAGERLLPAFNTDTGVPRHRVRTSACGCASVPPLTPSALHALPVALHR